MSFALPHRAATIERFCRDERGAGVAQFSRPGPDGPATGDAVLHRRCYVVPPSPMLE